MHSGSHGVGLSGASQYHSSATYDGVKVEEDYMQSPAQESSANLSYSSVHSFSNSHPAELSSWHSYSADRTQIHP
ncbi:hypothetical protein BC834DRAFT_180185 [Gloeopeniophorella convolvens]|nr:hypothetical protein BC834DRAFT_180185 [Gloeopeniophorella convolvens]